MRLDVPTNSIIYNSNIMKTDLGHGLIEAEVLEDPDPDEEDCDSDGG